MRGICAAGLALAICASGATAEGLTLSTKNRAGLFKSQLAVLDGRAARQYAHSDRLLPKPKDGKGASGPAYSGTYTGPYLDAAKAAARKHAVPEDLFARLVQRESGFNPGAVSLKGALGLAQLMPGTAARLRVDPNDPGQNLEGGARYLRQMFDRYGDWKLALAAYNAGPQAVDRHSGIPPYAETVAYVRAIAGP